MNIYVTDLDGTFIHHSAMVNKNLEAFKKLHDLGHMIIFASGRHIDLIIKQFPELLEIGDYFASENGSELYKNVNHEAVLMYHEEFSYEEAMEVYKIFGGSNRVALLTKEEVHHLYLDKKIPDRIKQVMSSMFTIDYLDFKEFIKHNAKSKILLFGLRKDLEEERKNIPSFADSYFTGPLSLELMKKGINKGYAVKYILEHEKPNYDKLFVFGDNGNDVPMLELADVSVSMLESTIDVKKASKFVATVPCKDGAVAKFLEDYKG